MRLAALWFVLAAPLAALAQPAGSGVASGGGAGSDVGEAVAVAPYTGHTAVVGTFEQTATFGPGVSVTSADAPAARSDAFVAFYAPDGTALWARRMGTDVFNDFGAGVALSPTFFSGDPTVYVSGYFTGVATFDGGANPTVTLTTRSDFDAFLAAYSSAGDLLWVQRAGGVDQDTGRGVAADETGVYWTGSFSGTATWDDAITPVTRASAGSSDGFLARYATDGTLDWLLTVGGPEGDDLRGLAASPYAFLSPTLFATGTFRSVALFGTVPLQSRGLSDAAVLSVDRQTGAVAWARQIGGNGNDYARGVAVSAGLSSESLVVAAVGSFENAILIGTDILTSAGFSDAYVAFYDGTGAELDGHRGGGAGFDIANAVAGSPRIDTPTLGGASNAPFFAVAGYVDGASTFGTRAVAAQGTDAFLAVYRDSLDAPRLLDALAVGGTNADRGAGVAVGGAVAGQGFEFPIVLTGSFRGTVPFGGGTVTSAGSNDVLLATVPGCPAYGCPIITPAAEAPGGGLPALSVGPNPARGAATVTLALDASARGRVTLVDARGRTLAVLADGALAAGEARWPLPAGLPPGTYWVRAETPGGTVARAVTVVR